MKTIWPILVLLLCPLSVSAESVGSTAESQTDTSKNDMVEFCAAALSVVRNSVEYKKWLVRYEPNMELVNLYTAKLSIMVATGAAKGSDILLVANDCVKASTQEQINEDQRT